jgi:DNA polymerase elongation subunit (family B)
MFLLGKKNGYLDIHIRNTYVAKLPNFEDAMSPVQLWDSYIYQELQTKNIQIQPKRTIEKFSFPGAYVVPPVVGKHKWVATFDLTSLYPSIQMNWRVSPENLIKDYGVEDWLKSLSIRDIDLLIEKSSNHSQVKFLQDLKQMNEFGYAIDPISRDELDERILNQMIPTHPEYIMTANGFYFKKDIIGCIPELLIKNYNERKRIKNDVSKIKELQRKDFSQERDDQLASMMVAEQGIKIMMNSEYGALANVYFRYCEYGLCSSITMNGQLILKSLINRLQIDIPESFIVFGDTDSVGICLEKIVGKNCIKMSEKETCLWIEKYCNETIQPIINETFTNLSSYVGAPENYLKMSREKIISDGIWTAKKHYAFRLLMEDELLLKEPKYGFKGLECVKSSIPIAVRELQKEAIKTILTNVQNVQNDMNNHKKTIMKLTPEAIGFPKTCNGIDKYSDKSGRPIKGAQAHVKAVLAYNRYLKENQLENQYPLIREGEKVRFVWLKMPNIFDSETFAFINRLPKDPMILEYIDYEKMYFKSYEKPISDILDKLGMSNHNSNVVNIDDLF